MKVRKGIYYFEVAGAAGGNIVEGIGGKGGVSKEVYEISHSTTLFIYIGGSGESTPERIVNKQNYGGYNGGGNDGHDRGGGGGATDIRSLLGNETKQLNSRLIVAGGGGGGHYDGKQNVNSGGDGGGINGTTGGAYYSNYSCYGSIDSSVCPSGSSAPGRFGVGRSGGGGGWWGGGSKSGCGGGGGSGFLGKPLNSYQKISSTIVGSNDGNGYAIISLIKIFQPSKQSGSFLHFKIVCFVIFINIS